MCSNPTHTHTQRHDTRPQKHTWALSIVMMNIRPCIYIGICSVDPTVCEAIYIYTNMHERRTIRERQYNHMIYACFTFTLSSRTPTLAVAPSLSVQSSAQNCFSYFLVTFFSGRLSFSPVQRQLLFFLYFFLFLLFYSIIYTMYELWCHLSFGFPLVFIARRSFAIVTLVALFARLARSPCDPEYACTRRAIHTWKANSTECGQSHTHIYIDGCYPPGVASNCRGSISNATGGVKIIVHLPENNFTFVVLLLLLLNGVMR